MLYFTYMYEPYGELQRLSGISSQSKLHFWRFWIKRILLVQGFKFCSLWLAKPPDEMHENPSLESFCFRIKNREPRTEKALDLQVAWAGAEKQTT